MAIRIYLAVFGTLLVICLCFPTSASLSDSLVERETNETNEQTRGEPDSNISNRSSNWSFANIRTDDNGRIAPQSSQKDPRTKRCLATLKRWLGYVDDDSLLLGDPNNVRFFLYPNPIDKDYAEEIQYGDAAKLKRSNFFIDFPLKIVIHGFTKSHVHQSMQVIKNAYLTGLEHETVEGGKNIILVDWEPIANPHLREELFSYKYAVANVPLVGKRVGEFIQFLIDNRVITGLKDVHIIGFSLGGHVAGEAGKTLKLLNAGKPPARITGLDPAGPAFYEGLSLEHIHRPLHKTDGKFVDVIHSNQGTYGTLDALGNVDFYPNGGGPIQQRCEEEHRQQMLQNKTHGGGDFITEFTDFNSCAHNKAPEFFAMSILNPNNKVACQCNNYAEFKLGGCNCHVLAVFGEHCDPRTRGRFYLDI